MSRSGGALRNILWLLQTQGVGLLLMSDSVLFLVSVFCSSCY